MARGLVGSGLGNALHFATGTSNRVDIVTGAPQNGLVAFSISLWFNALSTTSNSFRLLTKPDSGGTNDFFTLYLNTLDRVILEARWTNTAIWTGPVITKSQYNHLVIRYNGAATGNAPTMFLNNVSSSVTISTGPSGTRATDGSSLIVGNNTANNRAFNGYIDDVRLYNRLIDTKEIASLYEKKNVTSGLVGLWKFDELRAGRTPDATHNSADGVITGAVRVNGAIETYRNPIF